MPSQPFESVIGPFGGGFVQGVTPNADKAFGTFSIDPTLMPSNYALSSKNVIPFDGILRGVPSPVAMTASVTEGGNSLGLIYKGSGAQDSGEGWFTTNEAPLGQCFDTEAPSGDTWSYYLLAENTTPYMWSGQEKIERPLGMNMNGTAPTSSGAGSNTRAYAYTFVIPESSAGIEIESNPSDVVILSNANINVVGPSSAYNPGTTAKIRLYGSRIGVGANVDLPLYFIAEITATGPGAHSFVGAGGTDSNLGRPLRHKYGGVPGNKFYPSDHSYPGGQISRIADALHVVGASSFLTNGILWISCIDEAMPSIEGQPWYFPVSPRLRPGGFIEAIRSRDGVTYLLTLRGVWMVTGRSVWNLDMKQVQGAPPILSNSGGAARWSEYGLVYPSKAGLVLISGLNARIIGEKAIHRSFFTSRAPLSATYKNGRYYLMHSGVGFSRDNITAIDFSTFPDVQPFAISTPSGWGVFTAIADIPVDPAPAPSGGGGGAGVYMYAKASSPALAALVRWEPESNSGTENGDPMLWEWETPLMDMEHPTSPKRFETIELMGNDLDSGASTAFGNIYTVLARVYDHRRGNVIATTTFLLGDDSTNPGLGMQGYFPEGFCGNYLKLKISGLAVRSEVRRIKIGGVVIDE